MWQVSRKTSKNLTTPELTLTSRLQPNGQSNEDQLLAEDGRPLCEPATLELWASGMFNVMLSTTDAAWSWTSNSEATSWSISDSFGRPSDDASVPEVFTTRCRSDETVPSSAVRSTSSTWMYDLSFLSIATKPWFCCSKAWLCRRAAYSTRKQPLLLSLACTSMQPHGQASITTMPLSPTVVVMLLYSTSPSASNALLSP